MRNLHYTAIFAVAITLSILGGASFLLSAERKVPVLSGPGYGPAPAMLIIVNETNVNAVQKFATWKHQQGFPVRIMTLSYILSSFDGRDLQEKIRNAIISIYRTWGIKYVLLVGDVDSIPTRDLYIPDGQDGTPLKPTDYYYWTTQGTFDDNNDNMFGKDNEFIWFPDVIVGRIPASTNEKIEAILNKTMWYEQGNISLDGWTNNVLSIGASITPEYQGRRIAEYISRNLLDPVANTTRLYYDPYVGIYNLTETTVASMLENGVSLVNVASHGSPTSLQSSGGGIFLSTTTMMSLNNTGKWFVFFAAACNSARLDRDSLGKVALLNPHGGGVVYIGAAAVSWGGDTIEDYSDSWIEYTFIRELMKGKNVGEALLSTKQQYAALMATTFFDTGDSSIQGVDMTIARKEQANYILYGDPTLFPYIGIPRNVSVSIEGDPYTLSTVFVKVKDQYGNPVKNALVSISNSSWVVSVRTRDDGTAMVTLPGSPGDYNVTVSGWNILPTVTSLRVKGSEKEYPLVGISVQSREGVIAAVNVGITADTDKIKSISVSLYHDNMLLGTKHCDLNSTIVMKLYSVKGEITVFVAITLKDGTVLYLPPRVIEIYHSDSIKGDLARGGTLPTRVFIVILAVSSLGIALYALYPHKEKAEEDIPDPEW